MSMQKTNHLISKYNINTEAENLLSHYNPIKEK